MLSITRQRCRHLRREYRRRKREANRGAHSVCNADALRNRLTGIPQVYRLAQSMEGSDG